MRLKDLGYTKKWMDYGLLTPELLRSQISKFQQGSDPNTEHYRYQTFMNWLERKKQLTNLEINQYIELALEDTDQTMAGAALKQLLVHPNISFEQFDLVKKAFAQFGHWAIKVIEREELKK